MKILNLLKIIDNIHQKYQTSQPYICGGAPRDKYLGKLSSLRDVDITTGDESIRDLYGKCYQVLDKKFKIKTDTKKDGHSTIYFKNIKLDFSSNFIDPYAEKFILKVKKIKPTPILLEAFSRDFGCNSMLLSLDLKNIIDPTQLGKKDCDNKIIRTILPPEITFRPNKKTQNNTRIIRSIYLASKLDFTIDQSIVNYVSSNPSLLTLADARTISKKINLAYKFNPEKTIYYLDKMNLWKFIPINNMLSNEFLELLAKRGKNV